MTEDFSSETWRSEGTDRMFSSAEVKELATQNPIPRKISLEIKGNQGTIR